MPSTCVAWFYAHGRLRSGGESFRLAALRPPILMRRNNYGLVAVPAEEARGADQHFERAPAQRNYTARSKTPVHGAGAVP